MISVCDYVFQFGGARNTLNFFEVFLSAQQVSTKDLTNWLLLAEWFPFLFKTVYKRHIMKLL